jgi:hypothetical protein
MAQRDFNYKIAVQPPETISLTTTPGDFNGTGINIVGMSGYAVSFQLSAPLVAGDDVRYKFQVSDDNGVSDPWIDVPEEGLLPLWKKETNYTLENPVAPYLQTGGFSGMDKMTVRLVLTVVNLTSATNVIVTPIMQPESKAFNGWSLTPPPNDNMP